MKGFAMKARDQGAKGNNDLAPGFDLTLTDLVTRIVDSKRSRRNRIEASKRNYAISSKSLLMHSGLMNGKMAYLSPNRLKKANP